jgi:hypothetical protein
MSNPIIDKINKLEEMIRPVVDKIGNHPIIDATDYELEIYRILVRLEFLFTLLKQECEV